MSRTLRKAQQCISEELTLHSPPRPFVSWNFGGQFCPRMCSFRFGGGLSWQGRPNLIIKELAVSLKTSTTTTVSSPLPKQDKSWVKQFLVVRSHTCAEGEKNPPGSWPPCFPAAAASLAPRRPPSPVTIRGNLLLPGKCKNRWLFFLHA